MAKPIRWRGSKDIQEQPGSPDYQETPEGEVIVRTFQGPYETLFATRPRRGVEMAGYPGYVVEKVSVKPLVAGRAGAGELQVTLTLDLSTSGVGGNRKEITEEIDWVEVRIPIEQLPLYNGGGFNEAKITDTGVANGEAVELSQIWEEIKTAPTLKKRKQALASITSANHKALVSSLWLKFSRGTDSYVTFQPVARRTSKTFLSPKQTSTMSAGMRQTPPNFDRLPEGYEWLKTADRALRQGGRGKWERTEEWTGAKYIDPDLYPAA